MSIINSITEARKRKASDDQILAQIVKAKPEKAQVILEARSRGANSTQILESFIGNKKNQIKHLRESGLNDQRIFEALKEPEDNSTTLSRMGDAFKGDSSKTLDKGFSKGVAKEFASTLLGAGELTKANRLFGIDAEEAKGLRTDLLAQKGTNEMAGKFVAGLSTFVAPSGVIGKAGTKAGQIATKATQNARPFLRGTSEFVGKNLTEGAGFAGVNALREGNTDNFARDTLLNLGTATAFKVAGNQINKLLPVVQKALPEETVQTLTKAGMKNPVQIKTAAKVATDPKARSMSANLMDSVVKVDPSKRAKFFDSQGSTAGEWLVDRGIVGNSDNVAKQVLDWGTKSKELVDKTLAKTAGRFKHPDYTKGINVLKQEIIAQQKSGKVGSWAKEVLELDQKLKTTGLTLSETNRLKRLYAQNIDTAFGSDATRSSSVKKGVSELYLGMRNAQLEDLARVNPKLAEVVKRQNKETEAAFSLLDAMEIKALKQTGNAPIGLTDWIILAETANNPVALAIYGGKKFATSETARAGIANMLRKDPIKQLDNLSKFTRQINKANKQPLLRGDGLDVIDY